LAAGSGDYYLDREQLPHQRLVQQRWADIAIANIDISDSKYRQYRAVLFDLLIYFIIASKVVSDVNVIP